MRPRVIVILTFLIGLGLLSYSLTQPYYKDQEAGDHLIGGSDKYSKADYYKKDAELRTDKVRFMNVGMGLCTASLSMFLFLFLSGVTKFSDFLKLKSIKKIPLYIATNLVWLAMIPGTFWYYSFRAGRGDYPPFADSIGIPIYDQVQLCMFLIIPLNIFIFLATIRSNLPTHIFIKATYHKLPVILWEVFFGLLLVINIICFIAFVADGDHFSIPINLFFSYVLLALRAGQISRWRVEKNVVP